jgi:hypothetical protein
MLLLLLRLRLLRLLRLRLLRLQHSKKRLFSDPNPPR